MPNKLRIFISYRLADSRDVTERLHDRLAQAFGETNIVRDPFKPGDDIRGRIREEVAICTIMLVVIGPEWLTTSDANNPSQRKIDNVNDWVRFEIETALQRNSVRVVPVLVKGARMPSEYELPISIRDLAFIRAASVRYDPDFDKDAQGLIDALRGGKSSEMLVKPARQSIPIARLVGAIVVVLGLLFAFLALFPEQTRTDWFRSVGLLPAQTFISQPTTSVNSSTPTEPPADLPLASTITNPTSMQIATTVSPSDPPTVEPSLTSQPATPIPSATAVPPTATTATSTDSNTSSPVQIVTSFSAPGELPNGIACSNKGLLLADNASTFFKIDFSGKLIAVYQWSYPTPMGLGSDGLHFWVQTTDQNLIYPFQIIVSLLSVGSPFQSPSQTVGDSTNDMAWDGSHLWFADNFNLHQLDSAGNVLKSLPFAKTISGVDWDGTYLWVAQNATQSFSVVDQQGNVIRSIPSPIPDLQGLAWCGSDLWAIGRDAVSSPYQVYHLSVMGWSVVIPTTTAVPSTPASTSGLVISEQAVIAPNPDGYLNLRSAIGRDNPVLAQLLVGSAVLVLDGPIYAEDTLWWKLRAPNGVIGWTVEAGGSSQWLMPFVPSATPMPSNTQIPTPRLDLTATVAAKNYPCDAIIVSSGDASLLNKIHSEPSETSSFRDPITVGTNVKIIDRRGSTPSDTWYRITTIEGKSIGWIRSQYISLSQFCPS